MQRTAAFASLALVLAGLALGGAKLGATSSSPALAVTTPHAAAAVSAKAVEARYVLDYRHQVEIGGRARPPTIVKGIWTTETSSGRVGVSLSSAEASGVNDAPPAAELLDRFEIATDGAGCLAYLGFGEATTPKARGLLGTLASALWFTPGEGARWTVEEQDRSGTYRAVYERRGADEIVRRREGYTALRSPRGLDSKGASGLRASGETRFFFDDEGLREVVVDERFTREFGEGMPAVTVRVEATLRRIERREITPHRFEPLQLEALRAHGEAGDSGRRDDDVERLGGAGEKEVLEEVLKVASIPVGSKAESEWRTGALLKTRALLRVKPGSAAAIEEALEKSRALDYRAAAVLTGALGEAGTKEADAALARLLASDVSADTRQNVAAAMGMSRAPSAASVEALTKSLSDPALNGAGALALGAQARTLAGADAATATTAVDELLERYRSATSDDERLLYLSALANSGAPEALPVMRAALAEGSPALAQAAAYGLRFIPGVEVDALLAEVLAGASPAVKVQAIRAIGYRDRASWQPRLVEARAAWESVEILRSAIDRVLQRWS